MRINYVEFLEGLRHRVGKLEVARHVKRDPSGFPIVVQFNLKIHVRRPDHDLVTYSFIFITSELIVIDGGTGPGVSVSFKCSPSKIFTEDDGPRIAQHMTDMYGEAMVRAVKEVLQDAVSKGLTPEPAMVH